MWAVGVVRDANQLIINICSGVWMLRFRLTRVAMPVLALYRCASS